MKKLKFEFKLAEDFLDLKTVKTSIIIEHLEEKIKLREMPIEKHRKTLLE